jgi:hypothetical protein
VTLCEGCWSALGWADPEAEGVVHALFGVPMVGPKRVGSSLSLQLSLLALWIAMSQRSALPW